MANVLASVIVCTHNRAELLEACVASILADTSAVSRELIVVDNRSVDETRTVAERVAAENSSAVSVRYVHERRLGKSYALNRGVREAHGELLLFTDDDALVDDGWADALVAPFAEAGVGAVGGRVLASWPHPPPPWLADGPLGRSVGLPDYGERPRRLEAPELPIGANMALRRAALDAGEPFDPSLGHQGGRSMGHEEVLVLRRIARSSELAYAPDARVVHRVIPERMTRDWIRGSFFRGGIGLGRVERLLDEPWPPVYVRFVRAARVCLGAWRIKRRNDGAATLTAEAAYAECAGYMWAGKHLEMLFGRWPWVTDWMAAHLG